VSQKTYLLGLHNLGRRNIDLGAKNPVPEATGYTEAIIEIREVVLKVVFLEPLVV
jgi:hypothetical protein